MADSSSTTGSKPTDSRQNPSETIRTFYKTYQRANVNALSSDPHILDFSRGISVDQKKQFKIVYHVSHHTVRDAGARFGGHQADHLAMLNRDVPVYESIDVPGLLLIPSLLPHKTQRDLSSRLLHDALANSRHKTNIHVHYEVPYEAIFSDSATKSMSRGVSFFNLSPSSAEHFRPLNPKLRSPITVAQFLRRKLRWITLGGQ